MIIGTTAISIRSEEHFGGDCFLFFFLTLVCVVLATKESLPRYLLCPRTKRDEGAQEVGRNGRTDQLNTHNLQKSGGSQYDLYNFLVNKFLI
jgi:hypothetical protein